MLSCSARLARALRLIIAPIVVAAPVLSEGFVVPDPAFATEVLVSRDEMVRAFDERVLVRVAPQNPRIVVKWGRRVRLGILGDAGFSPGLLRAVAGDLDRISTATGHPIAIASYNLNFLIVIFDDLDSELKARDEQIRPFFSDSTKYDRFFASIRREHLPCGDQLLMQRDHSIGGYLLLVNSLRPETAKACLHDGLLKGFGLLGGLPGTLSTEDMQPGDANLTAVDLAVLHLLYDSHLQPGMSEADAKKQISIILGPHN